MRHFPITLIILDGWGYREGGEHNAIAQARTPFFDMLWKTYPHALLHASGEHIGLPKGQIGTSEIGHQVIGSGRVAETDLIRITKAAQENAFIANPSFTQLFDHVKKHDATLHILGLVSAGGIHSHRDHLFAFLNAVKSSGIKKVIIHAFTDGRDVLPRSAAQYLQELEDVIEDIGIGFIATVQGRFYAMDRDKNWNRLQKAEEAIFQCHGKICKLKKPSATLTELYKEGMIDELLEPLVFVDADDRTWPIRENDGVFFFNFRPDRARQLTQKIVHRKQSHNLCIVTMTEYDKSFECLVAFPDEATDDCLAAHLAQAGLTQSHIAETEKYAHVTYFFNGGREESHMNEHHILLESRRDVRTHDLAPEMRANEIADAAIARLAKGDDFILINFANADMVGHTANTKAIVQAVETIDRELKRVVEAMQKKDGIVIITADHGNAELNIDPETKEKHTAHTLHRVPFLLTVSDAKLRQEGTLADVAPTVLQLFGFTPPESMTGRSLLITR